MTRRVGVVVPTRGDRPKLLARAVGAALDQDHPVDVVVVADGVEPAQVLAPVPVVANTRTPGLPGARNTGTEALDNDLIAFCDDDDEWLPGKLTAQLNALTEGAEFVTCGIRVEFGGRQTDRLAGTTQITHAALIRDRMVMVHSSTFLARRELAWADERLPRGQNEDWDLALRAARRRPIVNVDYPLVRVRWSRTSHYARNWKDRIDGLEWMLVHHPDLRTDAKGAARVYGQLAFLNAALGRRRESLRWARQALVASKCERRVPVALAVASGLVSADAVLNLLHRRGRGV